MKSYMHLVGDETLEEMIIAFSSCDIQDALYKELAKFVDRPIRHSTLYEMEQCVTQVLKPMLPEPTIKNLRIENGVLLVDF